MLSRLCYIFSWFNKSGYPQGVFWIALVSIISNLNDILTRELSGNIDAMQIASCRVSFAAVMLLPIMLYYGKTSFATARPGLHVVRALLGFLQVTLWCKGVAMAPLANVSSIALTVPLFVLPLAYIFLHEQIGQHRIIATIIGFVGILIIASPSDQVLQVGYDLNIGIVMLVIAAVLFAASDILNKLMVQYESNLAMLFYFAVGTAIAGIIPAMGVWVNPNPIEWILLFLLGFGGNFILYCLLKAFRATEISALIPYRYLELIIASIMGYFLYAEHITMNILLGSGIIVVATLYVAYYDNKKIGNNS